MLTLGTAGGVVSAGCSAAWAETATEKAKIRQAGLARAKQVAGALLL